MNQTNEWMMRRGCERPCRMANLMSKAYSKQQRLYKQSVWNAWRDFQAEMEERRETVSRCVTSKRMVTKWFLDWYWQEGRSVVYTV